MFSTFWPNSPMLGFCPDWTVLCSLSLERSPSLLPTPRMLSTIECHLTQEVFLSLSFLILTLSLVTCEFIPHYCELFRIRNPLKAKHQTLHAGAGNQVWYREKTDGIKCRAGAGEKGVMLELLTDFVPPGAVLCSVVPDSGLCILRPWGNNRDVRIWLVSSPERPTASSYFCSPTPECLSLHTCSLTPPRTPSSSCGSLEPTFYFESSSALVSELVPPSDNTRKRCIRRTVDQGAGRQASSITLPMQELLVQLPWPTDSWLLAEYLQGSGVNALTSQTMFNNFIN